MLLNHIPARRFAIPLIILAACLLLGTFDHYFRTAKHDTQKLDDRALNRPRPGDSTPLPRQPRQARAHWQDFNNMRGAHDADGQHLTLIFDDPVF